MWASAGRGKVVLACVYAVLLLCSVVEVSVEGVVYEVNLVMETTNTTEAQQIVSMAQLASEEVSLALAPHALHLTVLDYASDLAYATQYTLAAGENTTVLALIPSGPQSVVDSISALGRWLSVRPLLPRSSHFPSIFHPIANTLPSPHAHLFTPQPILVVFIPLPPPLPPAPPVHFLPFPVTSLSPSSSSYRC